MGLWFNKKHPTEESSVVNEKVDVSQQNAVEQEAVEECTVDVVSENASAVQITWSGNECSETEDVDATEYESVVTAPENQLDVQSQDEVQNSDVVEQPDATVLSSGVTDSQMPSLCDDEAVAQLKNLAILYTDAVAKLSDIENTLSSVTMEQEEIIKRQHNAALQYNEDVLYKTRKELISEFIDLADLVDSVLIEQEKERNYDELLRSMKQMKDWIKSTLSKNSVRRFEMDSPRPYGELNRKQQEVVEIESTSEEVLHDHIRTERPGYVWAMPYLVINSEIKMQRILDENKAPQMFEFVIRPEEVIRLKYKKTTE